MAITTDDVLLTKIERLERSNRRIKSVVVTMAAGVAMLVALGANQAQPPKEVEAQKFVLRDETGVLRARFAANPDGAILTCYGQDGSRATLLVSGQAGTSLTLEAKGGRAIKMFVPPEINPMLVLQRTGARTVRLSPVGGEQPFNGLPPPPEPPIP